MHVIFRNDDGELLGDLHISRETQQSTILHADVDVIDELIQISRAHNVPKVTLMVPHNSIEEMEALGWTKDPDLIVMYRNR